MSSGPARLTRRQFVVSIGAASLGLVVAPALHARGAALVPESTAIPVRVGRLRDSGLAFRDGQASGMAMPALGGNESLTVTAPAGEYVSRELELDFPATHAGLHWTIDGQFEKLEVALRSRADGRAWSSWRPVQIEHHSRDEATEETFS